MSLTVGNIQIGAKVDALSLKSNVLKSAAIANDSCRYLRNPDSRRLGDVGFWRNLLDFEEVTIL